MNEPIESEVEVARRTLLFGQGGALSPSLRRTASELQSMIQ